MWVERQRVIEQRFVARRANHSCPQLRHRNRVRDCKRTAQDIAERVVATQGHLTWHPENCTYRDAWGRRDG